MKRHKRPAYIYVLHFNARMAHAEHYIGSTIALHQRLRQHAQKQGATITARQTERSATWTLATVYTASYENVRRHEKLLKNQHNASRYCSICTDNPAQLDGCEELPISLLRCPRLSTEYGPTSSYRVEIRNATEKDDAFLQAAQNSERGALGFIPAGGRGGLTKYRETERVIIADLDDEPAGYLAYSLSHDKYRLTINQCYVVDAHRLKGLAKTLVTNCHSRHPTASMKCHVRSDLPANDFWSSIGFQYVREVAKKAKTLTLNQYYLPPLIGVEPCQTNEPAPNPNAPNSVPTPSTASESKANTNTKRRPKTES